MKRRVHSPIPVEEAVDGPVSEIFDAPAGRSVDARTEICAVVDDALMRFRGRSLVSGAEVVDFLLDLRKTLEIEVQVALVPVAAAR